MKQTNYLEGTEPTAFIALEKQPTYAIVASVIAVIFISLGLASSYSKSSFVPKLLQYTVLSILGSLFFGFAAVFASDSFGVYV